MYWQQSFQPLAAVFCPLVTVKRAVPSGSSASSSCVLHVPCRKCSETPVFPRDLALLPALTSRSSSHFLPVALTNAEEIPLPGAASGGSSAVPVVRHNPLCAGGNADAESLAEALAAFCVFSEICHEDTCHPARADGNRFFYCSPLNPCCSAY